MNTAKAYKDAVDRAYSLQPKWQGTYHRAEVRPTGDIGVFGEGTGSYLVMSLPDIRNFAQWVLEVTND